MSAPEPEPSVRSVAVPPAEPPARARVLNTLSFVAIAGALGLVAVAAVPAWMKTSSTTVSANEVPAPLTFGPEGMPPMAEHPSFVTEDDEDHPEALPALPFGGRPPFDKPGDPQSRARAEANRVDRGSAHLKFGVARHALTLLANAGDVTHIQGQVQANERVMIVKELGDWVLVIHGGADSKAETGMGWVKKSEIAIR